MDPHAIKSMVAQADNTAGLGRLDYAPMNAQTQSPVERLSDAIDSASRLSVEFQTVTVGLVGYDHAPEQKDQNVAEVAPSSEFERITYLARELEKINARTADNMNRIRSAMSTARG